LLSMPKQHESSMGSRCSLAFGTVLAWGTPTDAPAHSGLR
jgi:hypothetical protein